MRKVPGLLICVLLLAGCAVDRYSQWTDRDAHNVAPMMAADVLSGSWTGEYSLREGRPPSLRVAEVVSRTRTPLSLNALRIELAKQLLASGNVGLVVTREPETVRADSLDPGHRIEEAGADLILSGWIDTYKDKGAVNYQINLSLRDAESGRLVRQSVLVHRKPHRKPKELQS